MGAWLSNSNDPICENYKKNDQYWDAVTVEYNSNTSNNTLKRQTKQCMSRWHQVNKIVNDFHAVYIEISQVYSSGQSVASIWLLFYFIYVKIVNDFHAVILFHVFQLCAIIFINSSFRINVYLVD
jgi:hypothetical protein